MKPNISAAEAAPRTNNVRTDCEEKSNLKLRDAWDKALGGGAAGAMAMVANVAALMWMRTTVVYQYRHGTTFPVALRTLYADGGVFRFYRGVIPTLIQAPLLRFGETAANTGMIAYLNSMDETRSLPVGLKTICASVAAATFRIVLMPVDTLKISMQVTGSLDQVFSKLKRHGIPVLYHGALAAASATFVGHFPWYFTFNYLSETLPENDSTQLSKLKRRAFIGFCSSAVSDTCSNTVNVIKVYKQSNSKVLSYPQVVKSVIEESGVSGLLFRGLKTKLLANGMQGILFTVLWKHFEEVFFQRKM